ncbi:MAG: T9SS type A sorting domain-containing protein [Bacteroidia bacterium]|nr:T9SS type A sorting domain-containing protein [Bacteroidia bacterium]
MKNLSLIAITTISFWKKLCFFFAGLLLVGSTLNAQCVTFVNSPRKQSNASFGQPYNWADSNLVTLSDDSYAAVTLSPGDSSNYLAVQNMGFFFSYPVTIVGIQVYVERSSSLGAMISDGSIRLIKNGVFVGEDKASPITWGKVDQIISYGGPADLWNETWSQNDITSPNFGFGVAASSYGGPAGQMAKIDYMGVQIYYLGGPGCLFSVTLEAFDVEVNADGIVAATWVTSTENDNDYFTLERSVNGTDFEAAATVPGAGNSNNAIQYQAFDLTPLPGLSFYRLKSTDIDGESSWSNVLSVEVEKSRSLQLTPYPNPASHSLGIALNGAGEGSRLVLYDLNHRVMRQQELPEGQQEVSWDVSSLPRGLYILMLETRNGIKAERVLLE